MDIAEKTKHVPAAHHARSDFVLHGQRSVSGRCCFSCVASQRSSQRSDLCFTRACKHLTALAIAVSRVCSVVMSQSCDSQRKHASRLFCWRCQKALCWLLQFMSSALASASEGGPAGNCTSLRGSFVPSMAATSCATVASRRHCSFMRGHNIQNMCCSCQTLYPHNVEVFCCRCGVPHFVVAVSVAAAKVEES